MSLKRLCTIIFFFTTNTNAVTIDLRIMETTDIHSHLMDFNYYQDQHTEHYGLVRTTTLIKSAKQEVENAILVDNGDVIQGSPIADYAAQKGLNEGEIHPAYQAMNQLGYVVGNIGNHEFNYGLTYLRNAIAGANFPYINANVMDAKTGKHYFQPYLIIKTPLIDRDGNPQIINIGYIGFVPPQIIIWDKEHLAGKVTVNDITETAKKLVPEMRAQGADLIIAIPHSGISVEPYKALAENSVYYLSQVPGIDAIMFGHSHAIFPSQDFANIAGVDLATGKINGIPAVMPGHWGSHLGIVDLVLNKHQGVWKILEAKAESRPIFDPNTQQSLVPRDIPLVDSIMDIHEATRKFVNQPIGNAAADMYNFLALLQDDSTIQILNNAQREYTQFAIQGDPDLADITVLSAAAPFRVGGRKNEPDGYVEVNKGTLTFRNAADLYPYPNTLSVLKVNGSQLKEWLECAAGMFNQINLADVQPQYLFNWSGFRTYNFDIIDGVSYAIDVTQPARYNGNCQLINPDSQRIQQLKIDGQPVANDAVFLIATNNYRANSAVFPGTGSEHLAFASPIENREILMSYISRETQKHGSVKTKVDNNWQFVPIQSNLSLDIRFETSPSTKADEFIKHHSRYPTMKIGTDEKGFAIYRIDLTVEPKK